MANPRIDELRGRLQREPGSRLFAQLAEELRKDGDLTEAIRVARSGLALHPNYPSARLTLGRALIESGNLTAARTELESVMRGAPDNILASRMLAECLEGLGDLGAALLQFRAALRLSPGDRQIEGQIRALEQRLAGPPPPRPAASAGAGPSAGTLDSTLAAQERPALVADGGATLPSLRAAVASTAPTPPPPEARLPLAPPPVAAAFMNVAASPAATSSPTPPVVPPLPPLPPRAAPAPPAATPLPAAGDFDDVFEAAPSWQSAGPSGSAAESGPILLLEDEAPTLPGGPFSPPAPTPTRGEAARGEARPETAAFPAVPPPEGPVTLSFEKPAAPPSGSPFGPPGSTHGPAADATTGAFPTAVSASAPALETAFPPPPLAPPPPAPPVAVAAPALVGPSAAEAAPAPALRSATLAELYLEQGFPDKAVEVYEQMLESDPYDQRARSRLIEIKRLGATTPVAGPATFEPPAPPPALPAPPLADDPHAPRRRALERTIARLEKMLVAVRRE